jgi:hypothetical protein
MPEKRCPKCNGLMSRLVHVCPHCGEKLSTGTGTWIGVVIGLLVLAGVVVLVVRPSIGAPGTIGLPKTVTVGAPPAPPKPTPPPAAPQAPVATPAPPAPAPAPAPAPQLAKGMTMDQVRQALGEPARTRSATAPDTRFDWWEYDSGKSLRFVNSVLEGWSENAPAASPGAPAAPEAGAAQPEHIYAALKAALQRAEADAGRRGGRPGQAGMLRDAYLAQVRNIYGITLEQQQSILAEGDAKGWGGLSLLQTGGGGKPPTVGKTYIGGMGVRLLQESEPGTAPLGTVGLEPGSLVRVVQAVARGTRLWYYLEVLRPDGAVVGSGWAENLMVVEPLAPPASAAPPPAGAARGPRAAGAG